MPKPASLLDEVLNAVMPPQRRIARTADLGKASRIFRPDVRLDTSQIRDLRGTRPHKVGQPRPKPARIGHQKLPSDYRPRYPE